MPKGIEGQYLENTIHKDKYYLGQRVRKFGVWYTISGIIWNQQKQGYDIYGKPDD